MTVLKEEEEGGGGDRICGVERMPGFSSFRHTREFLGSVSLQHPVAVSSGIVFFTQKALTCL